MIQGIIYHAISERDIESFNKELKEYTDQGYCPFNGISVAICHDPEDNVLIERYAIMLSKLVHKEE